MARLLKKCSSGCEYKIKTGTTGYMLVSRWRKTAEVYGGKGENGVFDACIWLSYECVQITI
jgi:hypothetical protein